MIDISSFLALNWLQGSILPKELVAQIREQYPILNELNDEDKIVICSHDCDVNAIRFDTEPFVELVIARKSKKDRGKRLGKSSRYLQIQIEEQVWYSVWAAERFFIERQRLAQYSPAGQLTNDSKKTLAEWLARRYSRAAFPSEFDRRVKEIRESIENELEKVQRYIFGLYFNINQGEVGQSEPYKLLGYAVMKEADYADSWKREKVATAIVKIQSYLYSINIEFRDDIQIVSDEEFSIANLRLLKRWDWDILSYDDGETVVITA